MKRRLFNLVAGVSLLLWLLVCLGWIRSYWKADSIQFGKVLPPQKGELVHSFHSASGWIIATRYWTNLAGYGGPKWQSVPPSQFVAPRVPTRGRFGFGYVWKQSGSFFLVVDETSGVTAPYWSLALLTALLPAAGFGMRYRRHRTIQRMRDAGQCLSCGYNLRATPDRCPECGTAPEAARGAAT